MKKLLSIFLFLSLTLSFTSCQLLNFFTDRNSQNNNDQSTEQTEQSTEQTEQSTEKDDQTHSEIINYYKQLALYNQYLVDKEIYDQNKKQYDNYLEACEKYAIDLIKYEKYISEYNIYLSIKNRNDEKMAKYVKDLEAYKLMLEQPSAEFKIKQFDTALTKKMTYLDREIYACFFSPLVDEVMANTDKLIAGFGEKMRSPIDNSKAATENIRKIFRPSDGTHYDKLESIDDKYTFYINNYEALCENIYLLTESLYTIYTTNGMVQLMHTASSMMNREDYTERLAIFIAQLVGLCEVLIDTPLTYTNGQGKEYSAADMVFNYRTKAGVDVKNRTISQIFEGEEFVKDTNLAAPGADINVEPPIKPTLEELPPEPIPVQQPVEPTYVSHPGNPPTEVFKPVIPEGIITE